MYGWKTRKKEKASNVIQYPKINLISNGIGGHSCNIGNAPNLDGKKLKTAILVFLVYFWYGLIFSNIGRVRGELKKFSNTLIWQDLRFFVPGTDWQFLVELFFQTRATSIVFAQQPLYWYFLLKTHLKSTISRGEQSEITISFWTALVTSDSWPISVHGTAEVGSWKTRFEIELSLKWVFIPCLIQI